MKFLIIGPIGARVARFVKSDPVTGVRHWYRFANDVPLNKSNHDEKVNVLDFVETDKKGVLCVLRKSRAQDLLHVSRRIFSENSC